MESFDVTDMELATQILEAFGIPKEMNVKWFTLHLDWNYCPHVRITIEHYPKPLEINKYGEIISLIKKFKLVPLEEEGGEDNAVQQS